MKRLFSLAGGAALAAAVFWAQAAQAQPDLAFGAGGTVRRVAHTSSGFIEGVVADERGVPLAGAMVSALGATSAVAVTDTHGFFVIESLPPGSYVLRAHLTGYATSRRQFVEVRATTQARYAITLQRAGSAAARAATQAGPRTPPPPPKVLAAGLVPVEPRFDPLSLDPFGLGGASAKGGGDASETAWRLRHLPRSVLKETTDRGSAAAGAGRGAAGRKLSPPGGSALSRALGAPVRILGDLPVTGQVNLMTSASFDGGPGSSSGESGMRGSALLGLAGPAWGYGDWSARVMTQGAPGSWFLSGRFGNRAPSRNRYQVGFAYSSQRTASTAAPGHVSLDRTEPRDRSAGLLYGTGRFTVTPRLLVDYGGRVAWYDYMRSGALVSPSVVVTLVPIERFRIRLGASQRRVAPGAEEFMEPFAGGLWAPPERTFVAFSPLVPEKTTQFDVTLEHDLTPRLSVTFRSFYQNTTDQQMLFFGDVVAGQSGRYGVGDVGDVLTRGYSFGVSHHLVSRLRGSIAYELTRARWWTTAPGEELLLLGFGRRPGREQLHGLLTTVETDLPRTETHLFVAYRLNTGFLRREGDTTGSGFDSRFDVEVTQRLRFLDFTSAQWQALLVVKNVFRDQARDSSAYDELLVVNPPTRILGGFVVRF